MERKERKVADILKELGISPNLAGYGYLKTAIMWLSNADKYDRGWCSLYKDIAEMHNTTWSTVERGIRHAIEVAWRRGDLSVQYRLFKYAYSSDKGKPTNGEFIATLAEYIRLYMKEDANECSKHEGGS